MLACFTGIALVNVLSAGLQIAAIPGLPQQDQLDALGLSSPADGLLAVVGSVAVEDIVLVGALTTLMTAARSPRWAVYGVVTLIEVLIHGYLGLPALGMIAYGVMRVRLYLRYGRVLPLIIGHTVWDLTTTLPSLLHASPLMHTAIVAGVGSGWIIAYTYAERRATVEKEYAAREATRQAGPGITRDLPVAGATDERALE
ncbi:type II CAAX prenyl endopeptidase Rce1 family protein [Streptomyces sp. NPDC007088]|uniref:CPBP family glutamic-type intramembrane protease n=1 Tax=Streptomyces sp. NPDC007088 TaxID=3364773 RepID=UPI0036D0FF59